MSVHEWYDDSCCGNCHREGCWGECPGYADFEAAAVLGWRTAVS